ncbi:MAG: TMEM175 family protein [Minisyncoccia bacterium]
MKQLRMEQLADGIFAIVMTLLVFEVHVPDLNGVVTAGKLAIAMLSNVPAVLSFILSFILLFTYWRSHHFITSVFAKNIDINMTNINAIFLLFVALVPFSSSLLGRYSTNIFAIIIFSVHVILIGISLFWMRRYAEKSVQIETDVVTKYESNHAYVRILFPVFCAVVAIVVAYYSTTLSLFLLTIGILFNLSRRSTSYIFAFLRLFNRNLEG